MNFDLYPTWDAFLNEFLVKGGLIEGSPPSDSITSLSVDLFIDPVGEVKVLATHDQVGKREREGGREGERGRGGGGRKGGREGGKYVPPPELCATKCRSTHNNNCYYNYKSTQLLTQMLL